MELWSQKVELLVGVWPKEKLSELVMRLILNTSGTAFQKLQLHRDELQSNDLKAVRRLIEIVGGTWGQVPLEKRFELAEKVLYKIQQKPDETNDSYLARADIAWTELLQKKMDLPQLQAYITLRNSNLAGEDKKRVLVESGAEKEVTLTMEKVTAAVRMLGTSFFQDYTGQKKNRTKVYDQATLMAEEEIENDDEEIYVTETNEDEMLETLAMEGDEDAVLITQFEEAVTESIQNDQELATYYSAYQDARKRLNDRAKFRGFWPTRKGSGKKGIGKGKGLGKKTLAQRISETNCRLCGRKGHWKAECPNRGAGATTTGTTPTAPATYAAVSIEEQMPEALLTVPEMALTEDGLKQTMQISKCQEALVTSTLMKHPRPDQSDWSQRRKLREILRPANDLSFRKLCHESPSKVEYPESATSIIHDVCFASNGTLGVLDLGASQTVMGSAQVAEFLQGLPNIVRSRVRRSPCQMTFRFGNQETLCSQHALIIPLDAQGTCARIAIVPGRTPFLISNSLLCALEAVVDTKKRMLYLGRYHKQIHMKLSNRNLFLVDFCDFVSAEKAIPSGRHTTACDQTSAMKACTVLMTCDPQTETKVLSREQVQSRPLDRTDRPRIPAVQEHVQDSAECALQLGTIFNKPIMSGSANMSEPLQPSATNPCECNPSVLRQSCSHEHTLAPCQDDAETHGKQLKDTHRGHGPGGTGNMCDQFRGHQEGHDLSQGIPRHGVDNLCGLPLPELRKERTSGISSVCSTACGNGREEGGDRQVSAIPAHERVSESQGQKHVSTLDHAFARRTSTTGGGTGRMGGPGRAGDGRTHQQRGNEHAAESDALHGECVAGSDRTPTQPDSQQWPCDGTAVRTLPEASVQNVSASMPKQEIPEFISDTLWEEMDHSITKQCQKPRVDPHIIPKGLISKWVKRFKLELADIQQGTRVSKIGSSNKCLVMEVFCSEQSQLCHQVQQIGHQAIRVSLSQADLETKAGREVLFVQLISAQPRHVWYSPECKEYCQWSQFNASRTANVLEELCQRRSDKCWQIAVGLVLLEYQQQCSKHFH